VSVADVEDEIVAEGVQIIWVIEQINFVTAGLYEHCAEFNEAVSGSTAGWCVGDGETTPEAGVFDDSPFSDRRGFDILVDRSTMEVVLTTNHGTTNGNENISGDELLAEIRTFTSP
jgi:hypothetical protein